MAMVITATAITATATMGMDTITMAIDTTTSSMVLRTVVGSATVTFTGAMATRTATDIGTGVAIGTS